MDHCNLYTDIATRTGGDIYIGVVGPVRTGKSTFIKRFMELMVLPEIQSEAFSQRARDELPQSAAGRTIMTTEPKFVPEQAVSIDLEDGASFRTRLIDCVGYMVPGAMGHEENEKPRMVKSPWFDEEVPFDVAAETGTRKVICEHSTIGLVVTTDGSISDILKNVLFEFPLKEIAFSMPKWVTMLDHGHWLQEAVYTAVQEFAAGASVMKDIASSPRAVECPYVKTSKMKFIDLGTGCATMALELQDDIFYKVLGETTGLEICDEASLMPCIINLARIKTQYEKIKSALDEVNATGYGIVMPGIDELTLEEPEIVHQGGRYGVRLRASAPSINMIRTEISTEVAPIVGSERQSEELVKSLLADFEEDPGKIWQSNIFGKSLHELVNEGLQNKLLHMPSEARTRLQETIERVINEGCSGLICIIL